MHIGSLKLLQDCKLTAISRANLAKSNAHMLYIHQQRFNCKIRTRLKADACIHMVADVVG